MCSPWPPSQRRRKRCYTRTMPMNGQAVAFRDIGILAHIDAGKTSLTERLLYVSGRIRSPGDIDEGPPSPITSKSSASVV